METPEFEALKLGNVAEGKLEELFQEDLAEVSDIFENGERYERSKDDVTTVTLVYEIVLSRYIDSGVVATDVRSKVVRPRKKRIGRSVFYKPGVFTASMVKQTELFPTTNLPRIGRVEETSK